MRRPATTGALPPGSHAVGWSGAQWRAHRVMRVVGPVMGIVWAVFLAQPWQAAWSSTHTVERWVSLAAVAGLALSFVFIVLTRARPWAERAPERLAWLLLGAQLVLVVLSCLAAQEVGLVGLVFVCVSAIFLLRDPRALLFAVGSSVVTVVAPRLIPGWVPIDSLVASIMLATLAVFGFTQLVERNRQLLAAQDEVAVLAVERERERIARDMHDILGHSLTVISVKAELAARLLDVEADTARARAEMLEVQGLARAALADVRGMVTATRAVTLAGELAGARQAYDAAGIEAALPGSVEEVPEAARELFAWALREGTTNVLRHSGASRVEVTMTADTLVVEDDGGGPGDVAGEATTATGTPPGNGLHGLTERARRAHAVVEVSRGSLGGYRLMVTTDGGQR